METSLPNPPTDNLYKFFSIFGTLIIIGALVLPVIYGEGIYKSNRGLEEKLKAYEREYKTFVTFEYERAMVESETIKNLKEWRRIG